MQELPIPTICTAIAEPDLASCQTAVRQVPFAEIRLDLLDLSLADIASLFREPTPLIATCRPGRYSDDVRLERLLTALRSGAAYLDIEVDAPREYQRQLLAWVKQFPCQLIVSYHDYDATPSTVVLAEIVARCFAMGAHIAKVACQINDSADLARLEALYQHYQPIIALGLGEKGVVSRIRAVANGAPFSYAALRPGRETGPGQLDYATLADLMKLQHLEK